MYKAKTTDYSLGYDLKVLTTLYHLKQCFGNVMVSLITSLPHFVVYICKNNKTHLQYLALPFQAITIIVDVAPAI